MCILPQPLIVLRVRLHSTQLSLTPVSGSAGLRPIATCSPQNFDLVRRFGAEEVFDYRNENCAADIKKYTRNTLSYALDCVSQADTTQLCYGAIGRAGGSYCALEPYRETITSTRPTVEPSWLMVLSIFGKKIALDGVYGREASPGDREFGAKIFAAVQKHLDQGRITTHPVKIMKGGWAGVIAGVNIIREQAQSGQKLVYVV